MKAIGECGINTLNGNHNLTVDEKTEVIVAYRNFSNAPEKHKWWRLFDFELEFYVKII